MTLAHAGALSFGQRIRTPESVMDQHLATCMDFTMLYASCLEAIGLNPVLCLVKSHIFAGVWLINECSDDIVTRDNGKVIKLMTKGNERVSFVECTAMAAESNLNYDQAEYTADDPRFEKEEFDCLVDVEAARREDIRAIASRYMRNGRYVIDIPERTEEEMAEAPAPRDIQFTDSARVLKPKKIENKNELWESKLLDLSLHNMLLNLPDRSSSLEPIMSVHIDELENALADGEEFHIYPAPERMCFEVAVEDNKKKKTKIPWFLFAMINCGGPYEMTDWVTHIGDSAKQIDFTDWLRREAKSHRLYSFLPEKELDKSLTKIYRVAKASQQENGVSSLYMSIGVLRWLDSEKTETHHAPLILVPVEIERKSANQGYALHMRDEEPHINLTLLEMLKQNYSIEIGGLDPLPEDESGVDVRKVFAIIRSALRDVGHWDVVETCAIGNFSFAQFAMWNDIRQSEKLLEKSKIVRSLMLGKVDWKIPEEKTWENDETLLPISVDDTQLQAIKMANHEQTFVLHGPPGTGKSQTITSMIANLAVHGKRVLFVAEKMAALSVVEKRLSAIGLGDFCLELHSDKANKKHVLGQLDKSLNRQRFWEDRDFDETLKMIQEEREYLDSYSAHLHQVHDCGYSVHQLIDMYEQVADSGETITFSEQEASGMTRAKIKSHKSLIGKLVANGEEVREYYNSPLQNIQIDVFLPTTKMEVRGLADQYREAILALIACGERIAEAYEQKKPETIDDYLKIKDCLEYWADLFLQRMDLQLCMKANQENVKKIILAKEAAEKERERLLQVWKPEFLDNKDPMVFLDAFEKAQKHSVFGRAKAISAAISEFQNFARIQLNSEKLRSLCDEILAYKRQAEQVKKVNEELPPSDLLLYRAAPTLDKLDLLYTKLDNTRREAEKYPGGLELAVKNSFNDNIDDDIKQFRAAIFRYQECKDRFDQILNRNCLESTSLQDELIFIEWLTQNASMLRDWAQYNQSRKECYEAGLDPVIRAYESGMKKEHLYTAYRKGLCLALIMLATKQDTVLGNFTGSSFNEIIRQFKETDDRLLKLTQKEIERRLVQQAWKAQTEYIYEANRLRKAIKSNARGLSIRNLFESLPNILPGICPVMLMSPNSVSQYLERKNDLFDVVIFDEASQLPTCKAVGALIRAKDAVIVGDPRQMPPTSFFAGSGPAVDDIDLEDLDSILDDALALGIPSKYLQWHYRSKHESLIAFSNHQFYENKMFTFPSANDRERHVVAVHVDGQYKKSVNPKEAEAVVAEIIRRYHDPELNTQSIGVVTFNVKQQDLIYHLLAKQYQQDPDFDAWANTTEDPIFIKNLENVQGDERDVILFSIGYGPDEKGHISMNFGPINKAGGEKRLNVAFSRARITMMIFASLYSSQIIVTEKSPEGLKAFHDFLHFAEGNALDERIMELDEDDVHDGIQNQICEVLRQNGYKCETNVGHSDFHIDIAVIDPYSPSQYLMGIMLDGEQYRRTKNTRDREVAQSSVLNCLGWKLVRVWTMEWWENRDKQIKRLLQKLEALKDEAYKRAEEEKVKEDIRKQNAAEKEKLQKELEAQASQVLEEEEEFADLGVDLSSGIKIQSEDSAINQSSKAADETVPVEPEIENHGAVDSEIEEESMDDDATSVSAEKRRESGNRPILSIEKIKYEFADLPQTKISPAEFASPANREELQLRTEMLLEIEAPIQRELMIRKLFSSYGVTKQSLTMDAIEKTLKSVGVKNIKYKGNVFCWKRDQDPGVYSYVRVNPDRSADELPPHEIRNAICLILKQKGIMNREELITETIYLFGYKRSGSNLKAAINNGLMFAKSNGDIVFEGQSVLLNAD